MKCPNANDEQCRHPECNCHGFKTFEPRNLGSYVDAQPSAETRALGAVQDYIDALKKQIAVHEQLRDTLANAVLDLVKIARDGSPSDETLKQLAKLEDFVRKI